MLQTDRAGRSRATLRHGWKTQILPPVRIPGGESGQESPGAGEGRDVMARETGGNTADGNTFDTSRRRFLGGSGLAAIGAVIGGVLPLSREGAGIPQAHAQAAPAAAP